MPWSVDDVEKHRKGLTPAQKKKWVSVANSVLAKCKSDGGSDCEGKAIRVANSKFSLDELSGMSDLSLPSEALSFHDENSFAKVVPIRKDDKEEDEDSLEITCYGGGILKDHWFWGDLAFDLEGMKCTQSVTPILEDHDTSKKIAFSKKPSIVEGALVIPSDSVTFLDTQDSLEFRTNAKKGFPYQASIRGFPTKIQRLMEKEEATVNGMTMKGPGTIWRNWEYKETSVCVFGFDSSTSSRVFSENDVDVTLAVEVDNQQLSEKRSTTSMTLEELKQQHPELVSFIERDIESKFLQERENATKQFTDLTAQVVSLTEVNKDLEKKLAVREEQDRQATAFAIVDGKLKDSKVPTTLHDKVRKQLDYTGFVKEGVFDTESFTKAVSDEIKDWEECIGDKILGFGSVGKDPTPKTASPDEFTDEDQKWLDGMLSNSGLKK